MHRLALMIVVMFLTVSAFADTVLSPRSKAEHEADLKALQEKYGPKEDPKLQEQLRAQQGANKTNAPVIELDLSHEQSKAPAANKTAQITPPAASAQNAQAARPAGDKVRIDLYAEGSNQFRFVDVVYSREQLLEKLTTISQRYTLDHIVLYPDKQTIELTHLLELAKVAETLKVTAVYQSGNELRPVATK
jgi:hypothetical protein